VLPLVFLFADFSADLRRDINVSIHRYLTGLCLRLSHCYGCTLFRCVNCLMFGTLPAVFPISRVRRTGKYGLVWPLRVDLFCFWMLLLNMRIV
jgi:hypothetical protein